MLRFLLPIATFVMLALTTDAAPRPLRALLVAGGCCHDYAGQHEVLRQGLQARAQIQVDVVWTDDKSVNPPLPLYDNPDWAKGYDIILHDECAAGMKDPAVLQRILEVHRTVPALHLHCAMHSFRTGSDAWFRHLGLQSNSHGPQEPIDLTFVDKTHPITQPLSEWTTIKEELYNNVEIFGAHPLVMGRQKVKQKDGSLREVDAIVAWTNDKAGARSFSTSLGHNTATVADGRYLDLVTRGLLWACNKLEPDYLTPFAGQGEVRFVKAKPAEAAKPPPAPKNALGVKATASSEEIGKNNFAWRAIDGDETTRWCAANSSYPQWLQLEFDKPQTLTGLETVWENSGVYQFRIESSRDGQTWKPLVDGSTNTEKAPYRHAFAPIDGIRFLKIHALGKTSGGWASVREVRLKGPGITALRASEKSDLSDSSDKSDYSKSGNVTPRIVRLTPEQEATLLKDVKVQDGFEVSLFANSAAANYPVFVAAAPDGTLYVSSDGNGSLGRNPGRGRVIRLRDLDGDGRADETKVFCEVDSPRGLVWDRDRLYLVHPPHLSEFIDANGDGVAEKQNVLIRDIAFGFKDRPADHTTNGLSLGIDGWLYVAVGDFGFLKATGTDGRSLQMRGGGVVRLRPDGTGLETYSTGTRNILEVAISPLMDLFARDNTNDGGGWNVRFHHFTGLDDHGYPRLYKNFPAEAVAPLADYGGGSGCGAVYLDEPGFGAWNNAPFTADWGTGALWHHQVQPKGATFEETRPPEAFVKLTRPTDADVDALSRLYVASWKGATFNWEGPDVGYIVQVRPKGFQPEPLPDFAKATDEKLVKVLESPSHRRRLEAQRELWKRAFSKQEINRATQATVAGVALDAGQPLATRVAALGSLRADYESDHSNKAASKPRLTFHLPYDPVIREHVMNHLANQPVIVRLPKAEAETQAREDRPLAGLILNPWLLGEAESTSLTEALRDPDAAVRCAAIQTFLREPQERWLRDPNAFQDLKPLFNDPDHVVRQTLINALSRAHLYCVANQAKHNTASRYVPPFLAGTLDPQPNTSGTIDYAGVSTELIELPLSVLDTAKAPSVSLQTASRALARIHTPDVVTGLIDRLGKASDPALRQGLLAALCRLHFHEGEWKGDSWGTRPDTRGPYYQPEAWSETPRIAAALKAALAKADPTEAAFLVREMNRNRIQSNEALQRILALAKQDAKVLPELAAQLAAAEEVPAEAVPLLVGLVKSDRSVPSAALSQAMIALSKTDSAEGVQVTLAALEPLRKMPGAFKDYEAASTAFFNAPKLENHHLLLEQLAEKLDGSVSLQADAALLHLAARTTGSPESRELSTKALDSGWTDPKRRRQILDSITALKHQASAPRVLAALGDADAAVRQAAERAAKTLRLSTTEDKTPKLASLKPEQILSAVLAAKGDAAVGEQIFQRATCVACHTVKESEAPKGPYLGNIAQTYKRPELAQNILDPNKTIAQGFTSELITLKDGTQQMGFITLEGAAEIKLRDITAREFTFPTASIATRQKLPMSLMPPGLMLNFTVREFASLLDYLEKLAKP